MTCPPAGGILSAALSMVAPCHRLPPEESPAAIVAVREATQEISPRLGYTHDLQE